MTKQVVVIGAGPWGANLVRNHHALGSLNGVLDSDTARLSAITEQYDGALARPDLASVLGDPGVDAVVIATPAATHGGLVDRALDAGKHVFVEKPLCLDIAEGQALAEKAAARGLVLMVGHLLLYHPAFLALSALVRGGALGGLRYIYSNRLSLGRIRREENALWSFAPHDVSMILNLAGRLPEAVSASAGHYLSDGVADTTLSHLDFGQELQAHIFVSWLHPYKDQRLVVVGEDAMLVFNDAAAGDDKLLLYRHTAHWDGELPVIDKAEAEPVAYEAGEPLRLECEAFLAAVGSGQPPPSDAEEGLRVLRVLDACQRSIVSGERVALGPETIDA